MKLTLSRAYRYFFAIAAFIPFHYIITLGGHSQYFDHRDPIFPVLLLIAAVPCILHYLFLYRVKFDDSGILFSKVGSSKKVLFEEIIEVEEKDKSSLFGVHKGYLLTLKTKNGSFTLNSLYYSNYLAWMSRFYEKTNQQFRANRKNYNLKKNKSTESHWQTAIITVIIINLLLFIFRGLEAMVNIIVHQKWWSFIIDKGGL